MGMIMTYARKPELLEKHKRDETNQGHALEHFCLLLVAAFKIFWFSKIFSKIISNIVGFCNFC